jgi:two-component system, cell cycle sensor histidine kinase and response regulator CckA
MTALAGTQPIRVLLVEDNVGDARLILELLAEVDKDLFTLERVDRLQPALDRLSRAGVDVVLLDLGLPDSEGLETFHRAHRESPQEPIIVISGLDDESVALEAVRSGAQDYLVKGRIEGALLARVIRYAIERKVAEQALSDSAARWRAIMDNVSDGISVLNADGVVLEVNRSMSAILGLPPDRMVGRHIEEFAAPGEKALTAQRFGEAVQRGGGDVHGAQLMGADGKVAVVDFSIGVVDLQGQRLVLSIGRDVTQQRSLEQQLRQAQKMEAVGRLAGGVAHDFNNLLTAIFGYADLMSDELPEGGRSRQDLTEIRKAAMQAASLTRQLLAFSRQQVMQPVVLDLNDLLQDIEKMLGRLIGEDVKLRLKLGAALGPVRADPGQLQQVVMNLVVNARDAMPKGGVLILETADAELTEQYADMHQQVVPGRYVMLAVSDTGIGMDAKTRAHIFEPFYTTKEKGRGTGLGLSTVYGIVQQSDGYIWVYSEPGAGTTVKIYLPRVDAPVEGLGTAREATLLTGTETILIAEDDATLRPLVKGLLERQGYRVLEAANSDEALAIAIDHVSPIHLLITDVVMPGASGRELARRLSHIRPGTRVLYVSGYTDDAIVHHGMLEPGLAFLQKPFTPTALARKVREVLDAR